MKMWSNLPQQILSLLLLAHKEQQFDLILQIFFTRSNYVIDFNSNNKTSRFFAVFMMEKQMNVQLKICLEQNLQFVPMCMSFMYKNQLFWKLSIKNFAYGIYTLHWLHYKRLRHSNLIRDDPHATNFYIVYQVRATFSAASSLVQ